MSFALDPAHYQGVPVRFWPFVFVQLLWLDQWRRETGRGFLGYVCICTGRVILDFVADDPAVPKPWDGSDLPSFRHLDALDARFPGDQRDSVTDPAPASADIHVDASTSGCPGTNPPRLPAWLIPFPGCPPAWALVEPLQSQVKHRAL